MKWPFAHAALYIIYNNLAFPALPLLLFALRRKLCSSWSVCGPKINLPIHPLIHNNYRIRSKTSSPLCTKNSSFEAIRARMKKTIGGYEHKDFSDETLGRR